MQRSRFKTCFWCGFALCHKCRNTSPDRPAPCGGHNKGICLAASTRDHLIPRRFKKSRRAHSGYKNNPPIVIACNWCNASRGEFTVAEWRTHLAEKPLDGEAERRRQAVLHKLRYDPLPEVVP